MAINYVDLNDAQNSIELEDTQYGNFRATYKVMTFMMCVGLIYPNPAIERRQLFLILLVLLSGVPLFFMILLDMYKSWLERDVTNIVRHCTVIGPFLGGFTKMLIMFYRRVSSKAIIDQIDEDFASYNALPPSYKTLINSNIQTNRFHNETCWPIMVIFVVLTFPAMAVVMTVYNQLFKSEPEKYMVHDLNKPFSDPEERFESPYFELMFVYMAYAAMLYIIAYSGYDGFFGLSINHACLKMELYCKAFEDALKAKSKAEMHEKLVGVVKQQNQMFEFVELIKETFNIWLGLILIATMIQICNCMYHITEGSELDMRYFVYIAATIVHIYLPCRYAAKLRDSSLETATSMYCGGWEDVRDVSARRTVQYMMARGQVGVEITAFNLFAFNMDLFISILQTSYSMYTLLRS